MKTVTSKELKTKGISVVEAHLKEDKEVIISVRGEDRYVVMDIERCTRLREFELAMALQEVKANVDSGHYTVESVTEHVTRVTDS